MPPGSVFFMPAANTSELMAKERFGLSGTLGVPEKTDSFLLELTETTPYWYKTELSTDISRICRDKAEENLNVHVPTSY
jgi:hypothetical protein